MIDIAYLRQMKPDFPVIKPLARKSKPSDDTIYIDDLFFSNIVLKKSSQVLSAALDPKNLSENDLLIYSHIVYGYSLRRKIWGEIYITIKLLDC
jgi:hypothetical protein